MELRLSESLKLTLLFISGSLLLYGATSGEKAHSQGEAFYHRSHDPQIQQLRSLSSSFDALAVGEMFREESKQTTTTEDSIPVTLCVDLPQWQRPSEQTQRKRLEQMERYDGWQEDETLVSLAKDWWTHEVFSFTTYGLSARTDPHYLSGLWTALDHLWGCYEGEQPMQINEGEVAELWLINHRFVGLTWQDDHYVMTVEPGNSGLQLLHFPRSENYDRLPLVVRTQTGADVAVMSGDW